MRKHATSRTVVILVAVLLAAGVLGCGVVVRGSGNLETEEYDLRNFTRVEVGSAFEVEIVQSGSYGVSITADDNLFDYVQISAQSNTLRIGLKTAGYFDITARVEITLPLLLSLGLSGATWCTISGFTTGDFDADVSGASSLELVGISAGNIRFDISGASRVTGSLTSGDTEFDLSGASSIQLEGSASDMAINASGASRVELAGFAANNANIRLSGASTGTVNLDGRLDADLSGASNLRYTGEPIMGDIDVSDASTLSRG